MPTYKYSARAPSNINKLAAALNPSSFNPTDAGGDFAMQFWNPGGANGFRAFVGITDFSDIPSGETVTDVEIRIRQLSATSAWNNNGGTGTPTGEMYRVLRSIVPAQTSWNEFATGNAWQVGGGQGALDRAATPSKTFTIPLGQVVNDLLTITSSPGLVADVQSRIGTSGVPLYWQIFARTDGAFNESTNYYGPGEYGDGRSLEIFITTTAGGSAATLSSPTPSGTLGTQTTATVGATTDQNTGTFFAVVGTGSQLTGVTATQIKAGQQASGAAALAAGSSAVSTTSPSVGLTGLVAGTTYTYAAIQNNANGDTNIVTGSFTTAAVARPRRRFGVPLRRPGFRVRP
jgi:hypothetical protein